MKKITTLTMIAAFAALTFAGCKKCIETERTWQCTITSYEYEGISAPVTVTVPFTGTYRQAQQFEAARTVTNPNGEKIQECHCR